jgi:hypothetical protein
MKIIFLMLFIFITACSVDVEELSNLTPLECRAYGVNVSDGQQITGSIVSSRFVTLGKMYKECEGDHRQGCAKGINKVFPDPEHKYEIWYAEHKCVPWHEACHALYETWDHTEKFNLRTMQGDKLAACP